MSALINRDVRNSSSNREDVPENVDYISSSLQSEYIPFYAMFNGRFLKAGDTRYILYDFPRKATNALNRLAYFELAMKEYVEPLTFIKSGRNYKVCKHFISDNDPQTNEETILYTLAVKSDSIYSIDLANLDPTKLKVLINTKFETSPERRLMFNLFKKLYFPSFQELGIDIVFTSDIRRWCFKNVELSFQFSTIVEMKNFFRETTKEVINGITKNRVDRLRAERAANEARERLLHERYLAAERRERERTEERRLQQIRDEEEYSRRLAERRAEAGSPLSSESDPRFAVSIDPIVSVSDQGTVTITREATDEDGNLLRVAAQYTSEQLSGYTTSTGLPTEAFLSSSANYIAGVDPFRSTGRWTNVRPPERVQPRIRIVDDLPGGELEQVSELVDRIINNSPEAEVSNSGRLDPFGREEPTREDEQGANYYESDDGDAGEESDEYDFDTSDYTIGDSDLDDPDLPY